MNKSFYVSYMDIVVVSFLYIGEAVEVAFCQPCQL